MAHKPEVLPPTTPLLCDHLIKTYTTANIGVNVYTSVGTSCCRSEYLVWGRQGWSSSILELTAHTAAILSSRRFFCLTSEQLICRHYRWTLQQDGAPAHTARTTMDYLKKEHINFIKPHTWPPNSPDINPVDYAISGALQQRV